MMSVIAVKCSVSTRETTSGGIFSEMPVKPLRSVNMIVISRTSPPSARRFGSARSWSTTVGATYREKARFTSSRRARSAK